MRKYIGVLLLLGLTLTSCGQKEATPPANTQETPVPLETNITKSDMVEKGSKVAVHYTGTLEDGTKFDSSVDRGSPLEFTAGAGQMIPGFDAGVMGMKVGDKKTLTLAPAEAYGEYDETRKETVTRDKLESFTAAGFTLEVGEKIPTQMGTFKVIESNETEVTLDINHELAGKTLLFDIELMEIK